MQVRHLSDPRIVILSKQPGNTTVQLIRFRVNESESDECWEEQVERVENQVYV